MATQGPLYPATVTTEVGPSGDNDWLTPANIGADDATEAQITAATFDDLDHSWRLKAQNFGFTIPTGATIDGIVVEIDRRTIVGGARDQEVRLYDAAGALVGADKATATAWPTTTAVATYGGATDTWTASPTVAMVNDPDFGVALIAAVTANNTDIGVDFIRVTVYYTAAPPPTADNAYETAIFADSPVAVWSMEEASGNLTDLIASAIATAAGGPTYGAVGPISGKTAITFDNVDDAFDAGDLAVADFGTGDFAVEALFESTDAGWGFIASKKGDTGTGVGWQIGLNDVGQFRFEASNGTTHNVFTPSSTGFRDGAWHHIVAQRVSGTLRIYVEAVQQGTGLASTVDVSSTQTVRLGRTGEASTFFNGGLAYIALYGASLSEARITAHKDAASGSAIARTAADALAAAESLVRVFAGLRTTSDAQGRTDAATRSFSGSRTTTDGLTLGDVATQIKTVLRSASDALGLTDAATRVLALLRSTADASSRADSATRTGSFARATTDAIARSDVASSVRAFVRSTTDAITRSDVASRAVSLVRAVTDASARADAVTRVGNFLRSTTDGITWADVVEAVKSGSQIARTAADALGLADAATRAGNFIRSTTDASARADAASRAVDFIRSTTDAIGRTDAASRVLAAVRTASDSATYTDAATRALALVRSATDAIAHSDVAVGVITAFTVIGSAVISLIERIAAALGLTERYAASMTLSLRYEAALSVATEYDLNDTASPSVTFTVDGAATDPTTITLTVIPPDKSTATYTYAGGTVTKSSTGVYTKNITLNQRGVWYLQFAGTGACQATAEATLRVRA